TYLALQALGSGRSSGSTNGPELPDHAARTLTPSRLGEYETNAWAPMFEAAHFLQDPSGDFEARAWVPILGAANFLGRSADEAGARAAHELLVILGANKLFHGAQPAAREPPLDDATAAQRLLECLTASKVGHGAQ